MTIPDSRTEKRILDSMALGVASTDTKRQLDAMRALEYYRSHAFQVKDLDERFADQFTDRSKWEKIHKCCYNLTAAVVNTLSMIYSCPVIREWADKGVQEAWGKIGASFDRTMKNVDSYTWLTGTTAVRPVWNKAAKVLSFHIYTGNLIDVTASPTNPAEPMQIRFKWKDRGSVIEHIWDADKFTETVNDVPVDNEDQKGVNPYGEIPIVLFHNADLLWSTLDLPATDLVEANLVANWLVTNLNDIGVLQTAGLLWTKGWNSKDKLSVGQRSWVDLPDDGEVGYANSGVDIQKLTEIINLNLSMFFSSRRIPESAIRAASSTTKSGVAMVAEQSSLIDIYDARKQQFADKDAQLTALALMVEHHGRTGQVKKFPKPSIRYREFKRPLSADERAQWDWEYQNGISTPVDFIMATKPGVTKEAAEKSIDDNMQYKYRQFKPAIEDKNLNV